MKKYINAIDLINAYINNTLSKTERLAFENELKLDSEFNQLYNDQLAILEGINRVALKAEINVAKQSYIRAKWMRYFGFSFGIILVSALVYTFVFKTEETLSNAPIENTVEIISDSVVVKNIFDVKIAVVDSKDVESTKEVKAVIKENDEIATSQKATRNDDPIKNKSVVTEEAVEISGENSEPVKTEPTAPELKVFYKSVKKAPQIIEVNTEKEFTVTCMEGTKLTIPAKSFVDVKTGQLARGIINLEVTEYYKLSDMLLANLTTKSYDRLLETGGMLYLDANKKGSKLKLKSGKRIQMAFNNKGKEDMQLFSGEENSEGVNWKLQSSSNIYVVDRLEEDVEVALAVIEEVPIYPGCENGDNDTRRKCMHDKLSKFLSKNFDVSIAQALGLTGVQSINIYLTIDKDGAIGEINASASRKELGDEVIRVIESLPLLKPGMHRGKAARTTFYLPFTVKLEGRTVNQLPITVRRDRTFINRFEKNLDSIQGIQAMLSVTNRDIERYAFATSSLGWINCDRFARTTSKKINYKFKIKDSEGLNVKLIFKSMSSILPGSKRNGNYEFGWVPKDEDVVLIGIKWEENKIYLGKKETNIKVVSELELDFKEVTVQELKTELQKLNSSFN